MEVCEVCGKQAKNISGLKAHVRFKHAAPAPDMTTGSSFGGVAEDGGFKKYGLPRGPALMRGLRVVKMVAPKCEICTDGIHARDWYLKCPHNPYFHPQAMPTVEEDREPQPDGTYIVTGSRVVKKVRDMPNLREVPVSPRHMGVQFNKKRAKGWRYCTEVGVAEFCQYGGCWSQELPERWRSKDFNGNYCSEFHALVCFGQERKVNFEVGDDAQAAEKRRAQFASLNFR